MRNLFSRIRALNELSVIHVERIIAAAAMDKLRTRKVRALNQRSDLVISVGNCPIWFRCEKAVLKHAGYRVLNAFNEVDALAKIYSGDCGVLLLCYSVEEESRKHITKTFREVCPEDRIVSITNQPLNQSPDADAFVYGVDGAEALIGAVRGDLTSEPPIKGAA
jgi:hypothetical protein